MEPVASREAIYDLFADPDLTLEERIDRALDIGTDYLELPIGFFTRIEGATQEIVQATGDHPIIQAGETCPLEDAYCRRTVQIDGILAIDDATTSPDVADRALETFDLGTYIGAKVVVNDETYGTVCFAAEAIRDDTFTEAEHFLVELIARLTGHAIERQTYVAELTELDAELTDRQEIYRAVLDASFDLVFRIDTAGQFTYVSATVEELLGYPPERYIGQPFVLMLPDEETVELAEGVYERVMAGETVEQNYLPLKSKTGDLVFVDVRVTPIFEGAVPPESRTPDDIVGVQGMARDATDRHRRERLIRVLNRVLRHNLRNEMNVVSGFAEILSEELSGDGADHARRIMETSERLIDLSETAMKLEDHIENPAEIRSLDIVPLVRRVVDQVEKQFPGTSITVDTPESATVRGAPRVETALLELLENAAIHAGDAPSIDVRVSKEDARTVVRISDDGPGLPEQERTVLEEGEETTLIHGSGLGLWLVYWIVESIDGTIQVSEEDSGTSVEITLQSSANH